MVGRALLILRTSPSDGSDESSGKDVATSWPGPLSCGDFNIYKVGHVK